VTITAFNLTIHFISLSNISDQYFFNISDQYFLNISDQQF